MDAYTRIKDIIMNKDITEKVREKALNEINNIVINKDADSLISAFCWGNAPSGFDFWSSISSAPNKKKGFSVDNLMRMQKEFKELYSESGLVDISSTYIQLTPTGFRKLFLGKVCTATVRGIKIEVKTMQTDSSGRSTEFMTLV